MQTRSRLAERSLAAACSKFGGCQIVAGEKRLRLQML